jgi:hypothetical protein
LNIQVSILKGSYRGKPVHGVFPLLQPFKRGAKGGYITIENPDPEPGTPPHQRVSVKEGDFKLLDAGGQELAAHIKVEVGGAGKPMEVSNDFQKAFTDGETDEEALERIKSTFAMLDKITDACSRNLVRGLIVSGPAGCGKSFGVEKQLQAANLLRIVAGKEPLYEFVTGGVSAIGLYQKLYYNRNKENVLVFDDCNKLLFDEESLSLFMGAMNSGDKRRIAWNKESRTLKSGDIPDAFDFEGSIVFLTNIDFDGTAQKDTRIADQLKAIVSRCHYLDLEIGSLRDQLLLIKLRVDEGMLEDYNFTDEQKEAILGYMVKNGEYLREASLRMCKKIADWVKVDPTEWQDLAEATCLYREAKFKRLAEKRALAREQGLVLRDV